MAVAIKKPVAYAIQGASPSGLWSMGYAHGRQTWTTDIHAARKWNNVSAVKAHVAVCRRYCTAYGWPDPYAQAEIVELRVSFSSAPGALNQKL